MSIFKRDWELIDKEVLPSAYEQISNGNQSMKRCQDTSWFEKKVIYTFKCKISGRIKQKEFRNP